MATLLNLGLRILIIISFSNCSITNTARLVIIQGSCPPWQLAFDPTYLCLESLKCFYGRLHQREIRRKFIFWKWRPGGNVACEDDLVHNVSKVIAGIHLLFGDSTLAMFNQEVEFKVTIFGGLFASVRTGQRPIFCVSLLCWEPGFLVRLGRYVALK